MSAWVWMGLYAATYATGTERCQIFCLDVKGRTPIRAVISSQNFLHHLAETETMVKKFAVTISEDRLDTWEISGLGPVLFRGIDDHGTILGQYMQKPRMVPRGFLFKNASLRLLPTPSSSISNALAFVPAAISGDGEVFGSLSGGLPEFLLPGDGPTHRSGSVAVTWRSGEVSLEGYEDVSGDFVSAFARTQNGVLGTVPRWVYRNQQRGMRTAVGVLPVYFQGAKDRSEFYYLPLPFGFNEARIGFANQSGNLILGYPLTSEVPTATIIWQDDVPMVPRVKKGMSGVALMSGTQDGRTAVGSALVGRARIAAYWQKETGVRLLEDVAQEREAFLPAGWRLLDARSISPAGDRVFGTAISMKNVQRPFMLWLKERPRKVGQ